MTGSSIAACAVLKPSWCRLLLPLCAAAGTAKTATARTSVEMIPSSAAVRRRPLGTVSCINDSPFPWLETTILADYRLIRSAPDIIVSYGHAPTCGVLRGCRPEELLAGGGAARCDAAGRQPPDPFAREAAR